MGVRRCLVVALICVSLTISDAEWFFVLYLHRLFVCLLGEVATRVLGAVSNGGGCCL